MSTNGLLKDLKEKNINLELLDGELDIVVNDNNMTDELLYHIKDKKEQLLEYLKKKGKIRNPSDFTYDRLKLKEYKKLLIDNEINGFNVEDIYNLTPLQEGFMFHSMKDKESSAYFEQISLDINGDMDATLVESSWQQVVNRHDSLRTMFLSDSRIPLQVVLKNRELDFSYIDISGKDYGVKSLDEIRRTDRHKYFYLNTDPLFRIKLIKREENKYTIVLSFHHIILDGWCMPIILSKFIDNYSKLTRGEEIFLEAPPKYSEYISWLNKRDTEGDREYWKSYLDGYEELATIPKDSLVDYQGDEQQLNYIFSIDRELTSSLKSLASEIGVTLNTIIQTIWGVVLSRYNNTDDVVFGSTVSGRPQDVDRIDEMVGLFINTIPVRIKADSEKSFIELATDIQRSSLECLDYQYSSLAEIQSDCGLNNGLLDHIMVFENYPIDEALKGNSSSLLEIDNVESFEQINYDFGITVFPAESLEISFSYNPKKYSELSLKRIASHIEKTIDGIIVNKEIAIRDLDIIPEEEKNLLLNVFNDTKADYPADKTIIDLFEEQVEKTPDNIAVVFEDVELTYSELNEKANIVGHYLRDNFDIEPDSLVGVMLERSEEMIIALLGVLKSGAAYVPIDPEYPQDRIDYMFEDSNPRVVLSVRDDAFFVDIKRIIKTDLSYQNPEKISNAENLAYVIYTSGSTGKPKGVMIENVNCIVMLEWAKNLYNTDDLKVVLASTSINYDLSIFEIFLPLINGGKIILVDNILSISASIHRNKISLINTVPSAIKQLLIEKTISDSVKVINLAGEFLPQEIVEELYLQKKSLKVYDLYGPSEDTTYSTYSLRIIDGFSTIGKPIDNTQIYILNKDLQLLSLGVVGELCISGAGLARGYLNRPELTAEKFIDNPFVSGERMYNTGDLARWLPDGNIEFLGRIDNQVKIRGFRIELGEIENSLVLHYEISSAVVLAKEGLDGDKQLVAYIVTDKELEISELRDFLKRSLPDYMVPVFFIHLESFPLTPNGKVDRKALPELEVTYNTSVEYVAPRNEIQEKLVRIWQEVLGIEKVGILDNFFDLGGHSLKATRLVSRISKDFGVGISLKEIFSKPIIESIALIIFESDKKEYRHIEEVPKQEIYELSNAQRRLWILTQYKEDSIAYNMPTALVLEGQIQIDAFKKAYSFLIERHESLRTVFIPDNGEPRQKVLKNPSFDIELIDLRGNPDRDKEAQVFAENDVITPFNLESGPLVRFSIIQLEDDKSLVLFNMHHIISDGWSMNIFIREFLGCYHSFRDGETPSLKPLRIHYKDYSAWQNDLLDSEEIKSQKEYWLEKLSGELPVLDLPSDKIRPASQTFSGKNVEFYLSKEINAELNDLCRRNATSLFMMLQALVKVLFYRYTGQTDIIFGSPVAGRVHEDLEDQIGFYANTLTLRDTIESDLSFREVLNRVGRTCTEAFDNQIYPFNRIVEDLDIKRDLSRSPLFDVMIELQNNESNSVEFEGLELIPYKNNNVISKFDMTFSFSEGEDGLFCYIEYNTDIYAENRIERIGEHLTTLISSVIENIETRVKDLEIIPDDEKNLLQNVFNDTKADFPAEKTVIQIFEEQVEKTPDNTAVVFEDIELTYKELNERANIVAHFLLDNYSIEPDDFVGIVMDRSEKLLISILGVFKAGGAYIPVDPGYPAERKRYILEDSNLKVIIVEEKSSDLIDNELGNIYINHILESNTNTLNPVNKSKPENLAYVIYTSGSTGKPKGAMVEHIGMLNHICSKIDVLEVTSKSKIAQNASQCFDISVWQLLTALLRGGTTYIYNDDLILNPGEFIKEVIKHKITILEFVPAFLAMLIESFEKSDILVNLEYCLVTGEEVKKDLVKNWFDHFPDKKLVNAYGPTEASDDITHYVMDRFPGNSIIPIGKPVQNFNIYIIDKNFKICPIGIHGEIVVSGAGVGRGYVNNSERTALSFFNDPFIENENVRLYKTGDIGRWLPDGNIEFLGRIDNQVKIRGFRIELGEIENALLQFNDINSVVVLAKEGNSEEKYLIAYFTSDKKIEVEGIRNALSKLLPSYMIPFFFIQLSELPLTPNGKFNRKALPEPEGTFITTGVGYVAPRNEIEKKLVDIWQDILRIEKIGVYDNFFELGGHSLKATRVVSRISKEQEVDLSLKEIFENQTIVTLSELISSAKKTEYKQIEAVCKQESYDISNSQRRLWILDQFEDDSIVYNMPAAFILEGKLKTDAFKQAYSFMIGRHESLRTVFVKDNGDPKQKILDNPDFDIEIIDLRNSPDVEKEARVLAEKDIHTPFNLDVGPLVRITIIRFKDEKSLLLFNMHHIISDGWSMNIFIKEFMISYDSIKEGNTSELAPLRIHYKDYSAWQNDLLKSSEMDNQKEYWLDKLSGELPVLDLPSDNIRPFTQTFNGNSIGFVLPGEINSSLNDLCLENKASLFIVLQALVKVLFYRYTGQEDIILGSPIAGRVHEDLENQIGFYVNTLSLRDTIEGDLTFNMFLASVKKTCTDAFDNQDYPFDSLVDELDIKRDISRSPLFDVMVVLQNNETTAVEFNGLNISPYNTEYAISKFDMTFNFSETEEGLICGIEYNTDIYSEIRIKRMADHLKLLVSSVLDNPESKIKDLEIIPADEKNLLLNVFNDTKKDYPADKTIVQLFEQQVEKTPNSIAVVFEDVELTYRELNEKANIVGHYLRINYAIEPDDLVGIVMDRSDKLLVSILGVFKSGAAYVPVDPEYPGDRKQFIIESSDMKAIIIDTDNLENHMDPENIIFLDEILSSGLKTQNLKCIVTPDNLAYVIYTSGSTGQPKGAMVEHRGMVNHLYSKIDILDILPDSRIVQNSSQCFDISVWQLLSALLKGGRTYIYHSDIILDPEKLISHVIEDKITILEVVPSFLNILFDHLENEELNDLDFCIVTGEELKKNLVEKWFNLFPDKKMINAYGPTEASDDITHYLMDRVPENQIIPIGKTVQNFTIYIVDKNFQLCPIGVNGEIVVSGIGVGRGYVNDIERTALAFMDDPFVENQIVRLYRTGDLARWLTDGNIEFLGRIDNQVKIRGFRIELGEIENSLLEHKKINSAVVVAKEGIKGDKHLIAYFVSDKELELSDLKKFLKKSLPDYMIPSFFMYMETLPLTPNGKIDRKALPEVDGSISSRVEYVAPRNNIETILVHIYNDVLSGHVNPGIDDNFFELGGDSIKAIQIMSRLSQEGLKGEIASLFTSPTIREFALLVKEETSIIDQSTVAGPVPLSPIQKWFFNDFKCPKHHFNQAVMLEIKESVDEEKLEALRQSAKVLIQHHDGLRMGYKETYGVIVQENRGEAELYFKDYDLKDEPDPLQKIEEIVNSVQNSFNIENDTLIRFVFFNLKDGCRLLIVAHHLVIDGVSWRVLVGDLEFGYRQSLKGYGIKLPLKTTSFKDWSEKLTGYAKNPMFEKEAMFWKEIESRRKTILSEIDITQKKEKVESSISLSIEDTEKLLSKTNQAFNTQINDILLTALTRVISKWSGETIIPLELESHGRSERFNDIDLTRTIGWFTSMYPVVLETTGSGDIGEDIISVKEGLRKIPDNGIGYGIYKYLFCEEQSENNNDSEILFNYLGQFDTDFDTELIGMASETIGQCVSIKALSTHKLNFNAMVASGQFLMTLESSVFNKEVLDEILRLYKRELVDIIRFTIDKILLVKKLKLNKKTIKNYSSERIRI